MFENTKKMQENSFLFDSHLHILTLSNICLSAYLSFVDSRKVEESLAVVSAHDYIFSEITSNGVQAISGVLAAMEHTPVDSIKLLEDDLSGVFEKNGELEPLIRHDGVHFCGKVFDKLVITPLIMDFEVEKSELPFYYNHRPEHSVTKQAADLLRAIRQYRLERPDGRLVVRPYMGLNPVLWSMSRIESMLETHFVCWSPLAKDALQTWNKIPRLRVSEHKPYHNAFAGIKLYPPLGFDPWPDDTVSRQKVELIYGFCEKRGIPIISHCDDQGFRMLPLEQSFKYTEPNRWKPVLKRFPKLYLDIAHFGKQYYRRLLFRKTSDWQKEILPLLLDYPNVYTDMSFNGVDKHSWKGILDLIVDYPAGEQDVILSKILFGTDWPLCVFKINSAIQYWHQFIESPLPDELKIRFTHENPRRFHFR